MEHTLGEKFVWKNFFHWIGNAIETFLYVFLMMHTIVIHTSGLFNGSWLVPYFSYPAYIVCLTIAADYWIGENFVRRRTYFASTFISPAILLCGGAYFMPGHVLFPGFRSLLAALFSVGIILYSILDIRKNVKNSRQRAAGKETLQVTRSEKLGRTTRIVCLLSICCVLFENCQKSIMVSYGFMSNLNYGMNLSTFSHYFLSILSAILLARFVKAEFIPRSISD
jgi:hypothetical protein